MNQERLMKVLLAPIVSEKATMMADKNQQVAFRVMQDATKAEIKASLAKLEKTADAELRALGEQDGTQETQANFPGHALPGASGPQSPAQGWSAAGVDRTQDPRFGA